MARLKNRRKRRSSLNRSQSSLVDRGLWNKVSWTARWYLGASAKTYLAVVRLLRSSNSVEVAQERFVQQGLAAEITRASFSRPRKQHTTTVHIGPSANAITINMSRLASNQCSVFSFVCAVLSGSWRFVSQLEYAWIVQQLLFLLCVRLFVRYVLVRIIPPICDIWKFQL